MASYPDPPPPPTSETLTKTAASLAPALELLERFHHRNKNQHRLAKWWAQADMLRRGVRKMLGEVEGAVAEAERSAKRRKGKGADAAQREGKGKGKGMGLVERRAVFLRGVLGPRAFLAFTQLSADRQFAHLGLMLLGVLAQVDQAVAPFAPPPGDSPETAGPQGEAAAGVQPGKVGGIKGEDMADRDVDMAMDTEMGVAVSREEVMLSIEQDATPLPVPTRPAAQPHPRSISLPINPPSKRKLPIQTALARTEPPSKEGSTNPDPAKPRKQPSGGECNDEFDNIFGSSSEDAAPAPTNPPKKKKARPKNNKEPSASKEPTDSTAGSPPPDKAKPLQKKKKKARSGLGGDEFDDIFGSLDDGKSKKPKKKKRKKGDEFDDIFGGL